MRIKSPLLLIMAFMLLISAGLASGQTFKSLHSFAAAPDGNYPHAGGAFDANGNMFGTTQWGGINGAGTIWKVTKAGAFSIVYNFAGVADGEGLNGNVTFDAAGNMYGTAQYGGNASYGTVWKRTPAGIVSVLYNFTSGYDGANPYGGVVFDGLGNMYGTAANGGLGYGTLWKIDPFGNFTVLYKFTDLADGANPGAGPALDANGNLFGTCYTGASIAGAYPEGCLWKFSNAGVFSVVHTFGHATDGADPYDTPTFDANGNMYGTAAYGGANYDGTVWKVDTNGVFSVLHTFTGTADGTVPGSGVTFDSSGNMYGTASAGGTNSLGTVWEISNKGVFTVLKHFSGADGNSPEGTPLLDSNGNLFGTTLYGGAGNGTVYEITASTLAPKSVTTPSGIVVGGLSVTGTVQMNAIVPTDTVVTLAASDTNAQVPASVTVLAGNSSATFNITTPPLYTKGDVVNIIATYNSKSASCPLGVVVAATVHYLSLAPNSMTGGAPSVGTVYLTANAPFDVNVALFSSDPSAQVPANVVVPSGTNFVNFNITTSPVYVVTPVNISAILGGHIHSVQLLLGVTDSVHSLVAAPNSVTGGGSSFANVYLTTPAPTGGTVVTLSTNSPDAQVPATVTVPAGQLFAAFQVTTSGVFTTEFVSLSATLGTKTVSCGFGIGASAVMHYVVIAPGTVIGGTSTSGAVYLNGPAPIGGAVITLASSDPSAQVPATVTIPAGSTNASFNITSTAVASNTLLNITATLNGNSASYGLLVCAPQLSQISVPQTTIKGGTSEMITVTISGPAPVGGYVVTLGSTTPFATPPGSVTIPAGATSVQVTLASQVTANPILFTLSATDSVKTLPINMVLKP